MDIRSGVNGTARPVLLITDLQMLPAGRCDEPLSVNAGGLGFYRASYDDATFAVNLKNFAAIPDADKIALLDDQWALAASESGAFGVVLRAGVVDGRRF